MRDDKNCKHQWFEIKKIGKYSEESRKALEEQVRDEYGMTYIIPVDTRGVLVKCAVCNEQKELWRWFR